MHHHARKPLDVSTCYNWLQNSAITGTSIQFARSIYWMPFAGGLVSAIRYVPHAAASCIHVQIAVLNKPVTISCQVHASLAYSNREIMLM